MVDKISALRKAGGPLATSAVHIAIDGDEDGAPKQDFMPVFFDTVATIKGSMADMEEEIERVRELQTKLLKATRKDDQDDITGSLDSLMDSLGVRATEIRDLLKAMDTETKELAKNREFNGTAQERIRTSTYGQLSRKFVDIMGGYQDLQAKFKAKSEENLKRAAKIVKPDATKEEIQEIIDNKGENLFSQQIMTAGHAKMRNAWIEVEQKHSDIKKLEASIMELHQMFVDMATLVEAQGEMLDQIEYNTNRAVTYTDKAVTNLQKANVSGQKYRRKLCCMMVIVIVILVAILGPIFATRGGGI